VEYQHKNYLKKNRFSSSWLAHTLFENSMLKKNKKKLKKKGKYFQAEIQKQ